MKDTRVFRTAEGSVCCSEPNVRCASCEAKAAASPLLRDADDAYLNPPDSYADALAVRVKADAELSPYRPMHYPTPEAEVRGSAIDFDTDPMAAYSGALRRLAQEAR